MSDIYKIEKLKWRLMSEHRDQKLEEVVQGEELLNTRGCYYMIESGGRMELKLPSEEYAKNAIMNDLRLIKGVGPKTVNSLKSCGLDRLDKLRDDDCYCEKVKPILKDLEVKNVRRLQKRIERWHSISHPLTHALMGLVEPEELLFFDIETMGLRYRPAFLIGVGTWSNGRLDIRQYFARDLDEEAAVILEFLKEKKRKKYLVSFNGRSFDSRFIRERMDVLGIEGEIEEPHFDLLHMVRGKLKNVPNHKLVTLEEHVLGHKREQDISSALVPHFYEIYLRKKNPGTLIPIIEHNRKDIETMGYLINVLGEN